MCGEYSQIASAEHVDQSIIALSFLFFKGPILVHPSNEAAQSILSIVGTPVVCLTEGRVFRMRLKRTTSKDFLMPSFAVSTYISKRGTQD